MWKKFVYCFQNGYSRPDPVVLARAMHLNLSYRPTSLCIPAWRIETTRRQNKCYFSTRRLTSDYVFRQLTDQMLFLLEPELVSQDWDLFKRNIGWSIKRRACAKVTNLSAQRANLTARGPGTCKGPSRNQRLKAPEGSGFTALTI